LNRALALEAEAFDAAHPTYVGREVLGFDRAFADALAVFLMPQLEAEILAAGRLPMPASERLFVQCARRFVDRFNLK
jgi:hypothetical protein